MIINTITLLFQTIFIILLMSLKTIFFRNYFIAFITFNHFMSLNLLFHVLTVVKFMLFIIRSYNVFITLITRFKSSFLHYFISII